MVLGVGTDSLAALGGLSDCVAHAVSVCLHGQPASHFQKRCEKLSGDVARRTVTKTRTANGASVGISRKTNGAATSRFVRTSVSLGFRVAGLCERNFTLFEDYNGHIMPT